MTMQNPQTCLSAELLRQLSHDELSPAELKDVEDHVSDCERCRQLLEVPQSDPQWLDEIVPVLRTPLESPHAAGDHDDRGSEGESLESILRLLGPTDDPHMLGRIGSYEVVGVIGRGGMGVVFKAYEGVLNRFVAIKMLLPHLAASGAARKRFAREGQAAAAVIDDNVMPIYSVAEWQGVPYLVTQYSRGATLQKRIQDQGPLELKEILRIGMQTARGLAAAHAQGLVHRDVKPSNILLDGTVERALLTDFGLARAVDDASITRTGTIAGTPQYMSPEQARGGSVDARLDLFGLGCVLYAMCTGRPPFRAESSYAILRMITDDEPRSIREINPDIPEWLCLLISRLMAKSPDARFGNALEVAALLEQCLAHVQQPTSVPLPVSLLPHAAGRRSIFNLPRIGVIAMLGTFAAAALGMFMWLAPEPPDIAGTWTSDEWGTVVLDLKHGSYEGTMSNALFDIGENPDPHPQWNGAKCASCHQGSAGKIELKWSRLERRFKGSWTHPDNVSGELSLRLSDDEIRGAWTMRKKVEAKRGAPRLGDLTWTRSQVTVGKGVKPATKVDAEKSEPETTFYDIHDLSIWDREGRTQNIDLLCHYLGLDTDRTKALYIPFGSYDAGRMLLRARASAAKHRQIAQLLSDLRAKGSQPATDLTKTSLLKVYSIADLPLWSKDGKQQDVNLLMRFLRSTIEPPSWQSQATRAAYNAEKQQLIVQATPVVQDQIAAVLSRPLPDPVSADAASITACIGPQSPTRLGAVIAHEDINKGLDSTVVRLHVWDWSKSDVSRVILIQTSELGVLSPDGTSMLTLEGESLNLARRGSRQYSGFQLDDDRVITSLRFSPSGKYVAAIIRPRTPHALDRKDAPPAVRWTLRLLELDAATNTGKTIGEFPTNGEAAAAFSTDDTSLIYSSDRHGIIRRDTTNGNILNEYQPGIRSLNGAVGISASPDGRFVAVADYHGNIYVWETQSGKLLVTHQGLVDAANTDFQAKIIRFSPDGAHLALVSGNRLKVMETATGKIVKNHEHETTPVFSQAQWSPDGKTITLLTGFQPTNYVDKDGVASHPTATIFPRVFEWDWREGSPVLKKFKDAPIEQTRANATVVPGTDADSRIAPQATGKQLGTVLGKPIHEGDLNKNTSTEDNLKRLLLVPLTEDYCRKHGLDRADELNAKIKDENSRRMVRMFVTWWELNRHLYEKHGGRVEVSAFGSTAFDGMRKWLDECEQAGDFEITDPQLKTVLSGLYNQVRPGTMFAKPDQLKTAFDSAQTDRFIEIYAKIPAGAHSDPARKLVGVVFNRPIYLHERYLTNRVELPGLLYTVIVPELEERYRKQHPKVEPTDAEIDDLTARRKAGFIQAAVEQRKSLEAVLTQNRQANPKSPDDPRTLAAIKEVDDTLKNIQTNDGRSHAAELARRLKFQEHIFENYGGGRALSGGSQGLILDAQKRWLEERERLGEFQIADAELRKTLYDNWTSGHHPGARLIEDAAVRDIFNYNLRGKAPSNSRPTRPVSGADGSRKSKVTLPTNAKASQEFPYEKVAGHIASIKQQTAVEEAVVELRKITGLDFGNGVDHESRQAWQKWWEYERSCIDNAKDGVRAFVVTGVITANGQPVSGANVLAHVPSKASANGQYQLAATQSDSSGRYVMALGIPPFATAEESTWKATFTVRHPPRFVPDQLPVTKKLQRHKRDDTDTVTDQVQDTLEENTDTIFAGAPIEMNLKVRPVAKPVRPAGDTGTSPNTEQPVPQDKLPDHKANDSQSEARSKNGQTKIAIGKIQYSLPFSFPSVDSILSQMTEGEVRPKHGRIECELVTYQVSDARHYPLVEPTQLVHKRDSVG